MRSKAAGVIIISASYVLAIIVAIRFGAMFSHLPDLAMIGIADLAATIFIFGLSMLFNNSSMYDPYWSVKPAVIAVFYAMKTGFSNLDWLQYLVLFAIALYALRLTLNFYRGWEGLHHEDWRYRSFREKYGKLYWIISFSGIHLFPTIMVYLGCLPLSGIFSPEQGLHGNNSSPLLGGGWEGGGLFGVGVSVGAVVLAFIADEQLRSFRNDPSHKGKMMTSGLWGRSRHPNYLGEILFWWGLFLVALASGWQYWWTGIGALAITLLFRFISIPMMEQHILHRSGFKEYRSSVPALIPDLKQKRNS